MTNTYFRPISSIVTFNKGKPPVQLPYHGPDAAPYLTPEYLRGKGSFEHAKPSPNAPMVDDGDTVVLWDGSNAGEIFLGRAGLLASTMSLVRHSKDFDKSYFFYSLKRWENYLKGQTSGSGIPHVDKEILGKLELYLLPSNEQSKIAYILSTVDRAIEQTEALIMKQQRIKSGLMQDLLTCGIDEQGNLRSEKTHQFKDSPLGKIPVEWQSILLGNVSKVSSGLTLGKSVSGEGTIELPYLRVANVQDGYLDLSDVKCIRVKKSDVPKFQLHFGDVLMNEGGDYDKLGRGTMWRGEIETCLHQNHIFKVRPINLSLSSEFLAIISASEYGKKFFLISSKQSTNLASINSTQLKSFPIPLPSYSEQLKIISFITQIDKQYECIITQLHKLCSLKTALMQDLLTGRKRVTALLHEKEMVNA